MGWYVHLHVAFNVHNEKALPKLAAKHKNAIEDAPNEVHAFLTQLAEGGFVGVGPKGHVCSWGCIGNYTGGETFAKALIPFWEDLYREWEWDGPNDVAEVVFDSNSIVVFEEQEQSGQAVAFVIGSDEGQIKIVRHELPFAWGM